MTDEEFENLKAGKIFKMGNKTFLEKLSDKIWKTKKARFAAAKRMERYYYFSNVSMALTSVSVSYTHLTLPTICSV